MYSFSLGRDICQDAILRKLEIRYILGRVRHAFHVFSCSSILPFLRLFFSLVSSEDVGRPSEVTFRIVLNNKHVTVQISVYPKLCGIRSKKSAAKKSQTHKSLAPDLAFKQEA